MRTRSYKGQAANAMAGQTDLLEICERLENTERGKVIKDWILSLSPGERFTADDIRARFPDLVGKRAYGTVINNLQREGLIRHVGHTPSEIRENHARQVGIWERC